jgi:hypothetical protein
MSMNELPNQRIVARYRNSLLLRYDASAQAVYWSRRTVRVLLFEALAAIGIETGASALDIG